MVTTYIGIGSNLGDRLLFVRDALKKLEVLGAVTAVSRLYETKAQYVTDQPNFLNAVCALETVLEPLELLTALKKIEQDMGRIPTVRYGERCIDLDILLYGDTTFSAPELTIPHAKLRERAFVLAPLNDIAGSLLVPEAGCTVHELYANMPDTDTILSVSSL